MFFCLFVYLGLLLVLAKRCCYGCLSHGMCDVLNTDFGVGGNAYHVISSSLRIGALWLMVERAIK